MFGALAEVVELEAGEGRAVGVAEAGIEDGEAVGVGVGERAQENGVDEAEDGGVGADADGQGKDGEGGEGGAATQLAEGVAEILGEGFEGGSGAAVADGLLDLLDAAAVGEGGAAGFVGRHAGGDAFVGEEVGVSADFGVEAMLDLLFVEQVAECGAEPGSEPGSVVSFRFSLSGFEGVGHGEGDFGPLLGFRAELAAAGFREAVETGAAVVLGLAPVGGEPASFFHAMERGEQRAGFDEESAVGDLLDAAGDAEAVELARAEGFEDEEVEGSLEEVGLGGHAAPIDLLYESAMGRTECQQEGDMRGKCVGLGVSLESWEKSGRVRTTKRGERRKSPVEKGAERELRAALSQNGSNAV